MLIVLNSLRYISAFNLALPPHSSLPLLFVSVVVAWILSTDYSWPGLQHLPAMRVLLQVHSTIGFPLVEALIHPKQPSFFDAVMLDFVLRKKSKNALILFSSEQSNSHYQCQNLRNLNS